ncbi:MAG: glycosyltransferase family 4 protein [Candidatus Promineifilaceae bacterium]
MPAAQAACPATGRGIEFAAVFLSALAVAWMLVPLARRLAKRWGILALPGGRHQHLGPVPKLGGPALFIAYLSGVAVVYWLLPPQGDDAMRLRGVLLGTLIVFAGGLLDDRRELSPWAQFAIQLAAATVAFGHEVFIERFTNPFDGGLETIDADWLVALITFVWIVGIINSVNWLDGLDGLAGGVGMIAAGLFAWHGIRLCQEAVAVFPLALAGALLGFLAFNFAPARIFLGSAGVYVLGYNLATLAILSPAKIATALLVLAIPILDGVWQVIDRLRHGQSPFFGDRGHLHFRLADEGVPGRWIVLAYYAFSLAFGLVAIFATGLMKVVILALLAAGVLAFLVWISFRRAA